MSCLSHLECRLWSVFQPFGQIWHLQLLAAILHRYLSRHRLLWFLFFVEPWYLKGLTVQWRVQASHHYHLVWRLCWQNFLFHNVLPGLYPLFFHWRTSLCLLSGRQTVWLQSSLFGLLSPCPLTELPSWTAVLHLRQVLLSRLKTRNIDIVKLHHPT